MKPTPLCLLTVMTFSTFLGAAQAQTARGTQGSGDLAASQDLAMDSGDLFSSLIAQAAGDT